MLGSATFTIVMSSSNMNVPRQTAASVHHFVSAGVRVEVTPASSLLACSVQRGRILDQLCERLLVDLLAFADVDRASYLALEARVEKAGRVAQRRAFEEGQFHHALVGL